MREKTYDELEFTDDFLFCLSRKSMRNGGLTPVGIMTGCGSQAYFSDTFVYIFRRCIHVTREREVIRCRDSHMKQYSGLQR